MKAFLMHPDRDFEFDRDLPANHEALIQDLELETLLSTMAAGDGFMFEVSRRALLLGLPDPEAIAYRQQVITDCLEQPTVVRELYALARGALSAQKTVWWGLRNDSPRRTLATAVQKMELFSGFLRGLHAIAEEHAPKFSSPGFARLFAMLREELDDAYLEVIERQLKTLKFPGGMLISAELAAGNKGKGHTLRRSREQGFIDRIFDRSGYSFTIPDRDMGGLAALGTLEDRGTNLVANALAQSVDHVHGFFVMLRTELAFYAACLNLAERLADQGETTTLPIPVARGDRALSARGLYDVCLALTTGKHSWATTSTQTASRCS
jgi:hypothetical protein